MEVPEVRRRLRAVIEEARRRTAERRAKVDAASQSFQTLLEQVAVPAFNKLAQALTAEGRRFKLVTPGLAVRLVSEFAADDYLELVLDTDRAEPALVLHTSRGRGRRNFVTERVVFEGRAIEELTEGDVVAAVLEDLAPFVER